MSGSMRDQMAGEALKLAAEWSTSLDELVATFAPARLLPSRGRPLPALPWLESEWRLVAGEIMQLVVAVKNDLRSTPMAGVYVQLDQRQQVIYIGMSTVLPVRLRAYSRRGVDIVCLEVQPGRVRQAERQMLDALIPSLNADRRTKALRAWRSRCQREPQR